MRLTVIIHESLHKYRIRYYGIPIYGCTDKFFKYSIRIKSEDMTINQFVDIALAPYVYLLPLFFGLSLIDNNFLLSTFGIVGFVQHLLNLPLEFTDVKLNEFKGRGNKETITRAR